MEQSKSLGVYSGYFTPAQFFLHKLSLPLHRSATLMCRGGGSKGPRSDAGVIRSAPAVGKLVTLGISAPGELSPTLRWALP